MTIAIRSRFQSHPFHLVSPSPWPILTCLSLFVLTSSGVLVMHYFLAARFILPGAFFSVVWSMCFWFRDIISEGTFLGNHTSAVQRGLNMGMILFIVSEALFFLSIFWTYFHGAFAPSVEIGALWPPLGIQSIDAYELPFLNTVILLSSGFTVTSGHHSVIWGGRDGSLGGTSLTVLLALIFTVLQVVEYTASSFGLSDSFYGSSFFFGTGFHGLHVIIGAAFIIVGLWRLVNYHFTTNHHVGLESSILYWHFVDLVWLVLFMGFYWWGGLSRILS